MNKIGFYPNLFQSIFNCLSGKTSQKAQCTAFYTKVCQNGGNINSLTAKLDFLALGSIYLTLVKPIHPDYIIDCRIKCHCIDQTNPPL